MSQIKSKFLVDESIGASKLAPDSVGTSELIDGNVTDAKLASIFIKADGSVAMSNHLDMGGNNINDLADPLVNTDAATKNYVDTAIGGITGASWNKQSIVLTATEITNQYVDLGHEIVPNSLDFMSGGLVFNEGTDYTITLTGGVGGVTRVTFQGDLASAGAAALESGDMIYAKYQHN